MYDRYLYFKTDEFGNDPLTDKLNDYMPQIPIKSYHLVSAEQEGRADLLSMIYFETLELWWLILEFNNFASHLDIRTGDTIAIPDLRYLNDILTIATAKKSSNRSISIK